MTGDKESDLSGDELRKTSRLAQRGEFMKRLRMLLISAALMVGGSALASAQPMDRDGRHDRDDRRFGDRDDRRFADRDDRRFRDRDDYRFRDRDDYRFRDRGDYRFRDRDDYRFRDRDDHRYFVGERRFINGYYWNWDGHRWCRRDGRALIYFSF